MGKVNYLCITTQESIIEKGSHSLLYYGFLVLRIAHISSPSRKNYRYIYACAYTSIASLISVV